MDNQTFRTYLYVIVGNVIPLIVEKDQVSEMDAIRSFYKSQTYQLLEDEQSKFWWMSPEALYEDYKQYGRGKHVK